MDKMIDDMLDKFMEPIMDSGLGLTSSLTLYGKLQNIAYQCVQNYMSDRHLIMPEFLHNRNDTTSVWMCRCGHTFTTTHEPGVLDGTDIKFCSKCGVEFNWSSEDSSIS